MLRIQSSLSWETWSYALLISRLSIETMQPGHAGHAVCTQVVSRSIADSVDHFFLAPILFHESRLCSSAAWAIQVATIFSKTFTKEFSRAIGW